MRNFREFTFWQDAVQFAADICILTKEFPQEERYALGNQMRRSSVSIASNISEGSGRGTTNDFLHFLDIALGSAYEVETQLYIANKLNYITNDKLEQMVNAVFSIEKRITAFINKTKAEPICH